MGLSAYAFLIIGVAVDHTHFWKRSEDFMSCRAGHRQVGTAKFCSECGGEYRAMHSRAPTEAFQAWAAAHRPDVPLHEIIAPNLDAEGIETMGSNEHLKPFEWLPGTYHDSDNQPEFWVLGKCMKFTAIIEGQDTKALALDERTISETMAEVAEFTAAMGMDTEPDLYLVTSCGY